MATKKIKFFFISIECILEALIETIRWKYVKNIKNNKNISVRTNYRNYNSNYKLSLYKKSKDYKKNSKNKKKE